MCSKRNYLQKPANTLRLMYIDNAIQIPVMPRLEDNIYKIHMLTNATIIWEKSDGKYISQRQIVSQQEMEGLVTVLNTTMIFRSKKREKR